MLIIATTDGETTRSSKTSITVPRARRKLHPRFHVEGRSVSNDIPLEEKVVSIGHVLNHGKGGSVRMVLNTRKYHCINYDIH